MPEGKLARGGLRGVALFCASLAVLFALLTFIGWISGLQLLASVRARYIPMAPSTALCFSLLGIGIVWHLERPARRWVSRLLAAVVLIIAVAKLVEFLSDLHFGIDAWFVRNPEMFGEVPTGRMAPMTALDLVFIALGLIALTRPGVRNGRALWARWRQLSARSCWSVIGTARLCFTVAPSFRSRSRPPGDFSFAVSRLSPRLARTSGP